MKFKRSIHASERLRERFPKKRLEKVLPPLLAVLPYLHSGENEVIIDEVRYVVIVNNGSYVVKTVTSIEDKTTPKRLS